MSTVQQQLTSLLAVLAILIAPNLCSAVDETESEFVPAVDRLLGKPEKTRLEHLLLSHFKAVTFGTHNSFLASGTYKRDDLKLDLSIAGRRPGMLRASFKKKNVKHILISNEDEIWSSYKDEHSEKAETLDRFMIQFEVNHNALYWGYEIHGNEGLRLLDGQEMVEGHSCFIIQNEYIEGLELLHYIDIAKGIERRRIARFNLAETPNEYELTYLPYKEYGDDSILWPSGYTVRKNGKPHVEVTFDKVQLNGGVGSWVFKIPSKL